jgi:hypothetical protein
MAVSATAQPVMLLDLQGRVVRRFTLPARQTEATFPLSDVTAGVYVLQASTGQGPAARGGDALTHGASPVQKAAPVAGAAFLRLRS